MVSSCNFKWISPNAYFASFCFTTCSCHNIFLGNKCFRSNEFGPVSNVQFRYNSYNFWPFVISGAAGGGVRISVSGEPKVPGAASTIAEEAVDQLQENEKLVAGDRYVLKL